jgi:hypothetical protein
LPYRYSETWRIWADVNKVRRKEQTMNRKMMDCISLGIVRSALTISLTFGVMPAGAQDKPKPQGTAEKTNSSAQSPDAHAPTAKATQRLADTDPQEKGARGTYEGIHVHGDWIIVIRNQDGTVASRHEFENALANRAILPQILNHGGGVGQWSVTIDANGGGLTHLCSLNLGVATTPIACILGESNGTPTFGSLTVTASATDLTLRGSIQATTAGQIGPVSTAFALCVPPVAPSPSCTNGGNGPTTLTSTDVTPRNIQVAAGQTIDVTVVISFS